MKDCSLDFIKDLHDLVEDKWEYVITHMSIQEKQVSMTIHLKK